ncbi:MAG: hypothetical protein ACHBN1_15830 [Heteroscytonema crispum UTEX LB 1556]
MHSRGARLCAPTHIWRQITNNPTGEPVLGVLPKAQYALHQQRDRASPVAWVGKTPLRPLGRPQDRSGSPTKGAKLTGGNLPDCRRKRPNTHQPTTKIGSQFLLAWELNM